MANKYAKYLGDFEPNQTYEEYKERFKEYFTINRKDGIIEVKMHNNGGPALWGPGMNFGWGPVLKAIGNDPENQVLIFGGTGDVWFDHPDYDYIKEVMKLQEEDPAAFNELFYDTYLRVSKMIEAMFWDIDIPTISVLNGPADSHVELAFLADYIMCAPNVELSDLHFVRGMVPGDGWHFVLSTMLGATRANQLLFSGRSFSAQDAYDMGIIGELCPTETIYERAWEKAYEMMKLPRFVRTITHDVVRRQWRRAVQEDLRYFTGFQGFSGALMTGMTQKVDFKKQAAKEETDD